MSDHAKTKRGDVVYTPSWAVCACLDETGSRTVTVWERCERCHAFMRMPDALAAEEEPPAAWTCEKCGASVDGASLTWPYPCPACGERNSFRAQEPPAARPCARGEQPPAPDDRKIPSFHHPAQEPPAAECGCDQHRDPATYPWFVPEAKPRCDHPELVEDLRHELTYRLDVHGLLAVHPDLIRRAIEALEPPAEGGDRG